MRNLSRFSLLIIFGLMVGLNHAVFAAVSVRVFNQNIEAYKFCHDDNKMKTMKNYLDDNRFDFILTQEYEDSCEDFFEYIKSLGYSIASNQPGDSTIFYKNRDWQPVNEYQVDTTYNTPNGWGNEGIRRASFGVYQNVNSQSTLAIGTAHLCVVYSAPYAPDHSGYSRCVIKNQAEAHAADITTLISAVHTNSNWLITGDMNADLEEKMTLFDILTENQVTNVESLNTQNFDMAFFKGHGIQKMKYFNTDEYLPNISDHHGFVLSFDLSEPF